jgi:hypothetical protein
LLVGNPCRVMLVGWGSGGAGEVRRRHGRTDRRYRGGDRRGEMGPSPSRPCESTRPRRRRGSRSR